MGLRLLMFVLETKEHNTCVNSPRGRGFRYSLRSSYCQYHTPPKRKLVQVYLYVFGHGLCVATVSFHIGNVLFTIDWVSLIYNVSMSTWFFSSYASLLISFASTPAWQSRRSPLSLLPLPIFFLIPASAISFLCPFFTPYWELCLFSLSYNIYILNRHYIHIY